MAHTPWPPQSPHERLRQLFIRLLGYAEDGVYLALGILLAIGAFALLITEAAGFWQVILGGRIADSIVALLGQLLLVIIIVELLFTVKVSFREHILEPQPFLIVAVIAVLNTPYGSSGILTVLAVALVISLRLLRPQEHKVQG